MVTRCSTIGFTYEGSNLHVILILSLQYFMHIKPACFACLFAMENCVLWTLFDGLGVHISSVEEIIITALSLEQTQVKGKQIDKHFFHYICYIYYHKNSALLLCEFTRHVFFRNIL